MPIDIPDWLLVLLTVATIIFGSGRLTRVIFYDTFPPVVWFRMQWDRLTDRPGYVGQWNSLMHCPWCLSFWITLGCIGWMVGGWYVEWLMWAWWVFWGALAASYVATIVIVRDEPEE